MSLRSFAPQVLAEAEAAAQKPRLPDLDLTDIPFATMDPAGSKDLDQAYFIERTSSGYRVRYAIADVAAFVAPGERSTPRPTAGSRPSTRPTAGCPLHPTVLSEGAASLLPGELRPALVWTLDLDAHGRARRHPRRARRSAQP